MEKESIRSAIDTAILMGVSFAPLIMLQISPNYPQYFPKIETNVFEQLSQINATILGFTLVGIFYYLGKLDDRKRDYILSYPRLVKFFIDYAGVTDNFFTAWLEFLKKRRKDALVNNLINFVENGKKNNLSHKELLSGSQRKMVESFDVTSKSVQILPVRMTIYLGGAIAMSLIALMFMVKKLGPY
jgi:hypothetical protein